MVDCIIAVRLISLGTLATRLFLFSQRDIHKLHTLFVECDSACTVNKFTTRIDSTRQKSVIHLRRHIVWSLDYR